MITNDTLKVFFSNFIQLLLLTVTVLPLTAKEISVCKTCDISSIQSAILTAEPSDTIFIESGIYKENLTIDKPIILIGVDDVKIDGNKKGNVIWIKANGVEIRNLYISGSAISDIKEYAGVMLDEVKDCKIIHNRFIDNAYSIYGSKASVCEVRENEIIGNAIDEVNGGNGIHLWSCNTFVIAKNSVTKHRDGLYFEFSNDLDIHENTVTESIRYGMHFMFSHNNRFYKNSFSKNPTGVAVMYSKNIDVQDNLFSSSLGIDSYGILLKSISESTFKNNLFKDNTIGIQSDDSNRNMISYNIIQNNGYAVSILANSESNVFSHNDFLENVFDVSTNSKDNNNTYHENYWDNYKGYDLNKDSIGDVPYQPVNFFSFWIATYPFLMVLYESPVVKFLELAERAFPLLSPSKLIDQKPSLKRNIYDLHTKPE
jgi:nitrous oxidase accessory protein